MKLSFRQGIVRHQKDTQGTQQFLLEQSSTIDLITVNDPTIVSFAHKTRNYVITEKRSVPNAWGGPFASGTDYWLYWDINPVTGIRTFGHTTVEPTYGPTAPINPLVDQHWFDTSTTTMKVFNGASFKDRIRVFAAKYDNGATITSFSGGSVFDGTQVANTTRGEGGALIFDDADKPLKRGDGTFITTSDEFSSGIATASNIKIEALKFEATASTNIAAYHIVYLNDFDSVLPATPLKLHNVPFGIIEEDAYTGELISVTTDGVICNQNWDWQEAGAELFIDNAGKITDISTPGMLPIGYVLSPLEILLKTSGVTQVTIEGEVGGGSGVEYLPDLLDVSVIEPVDSEVLTYVENEVESGWFNKPLPTPSLIDHDLVEHTDVYVTEPIENQVLTFMDNEVEFGWYNKSLPVPTPTLVNHGLTEHTDVFINGPIDQHILMYIEDEGGNGWINQPLPTPSLVDHRIDDHTNVYIDNPMFNHVLRYEPGVDNMPGDWVNVALDLPTLNDTDINNPTEGQHLVYRGTDWVNESVSAGGITTLAALDDTYIDNAQDGQFLMYLNGEVGPEWINVPLFLDRNADVNISEPVDGQFLGYDSEMDEWTSMRTSILECGDTNINSPTEGQHLVYRGTDWVNEDIASGPVSYPKTFEAVNEGVLSAGNMHYDNGNGTYGYAWTNPFSSGKTLYEFDYSTYAGASAHYIGINDGGDPQNGGTTDDQVAPGLLFFTANGNGSVLGGVTGSITPTSALTPSDVVAFLVDGDNDTVEMFVNNVSLGTLNVSALSDPRLFTSSGHNGYNGSITLRVDESINPTYDYAGYLSVDKIDTVLSYTGTQDGGSLSIDATTQWHTVNLTSNTVFTFDYGIIKPTDVVEFSLEIYPGLATVTWPAGVIGDTTITPDVVNMFTVIRRPAIAGMVERTYVLKVPIPNDVTDPLDTPIIG